MLEICASPVGLNVLRSVTKSIANCDGVHTDCNFRSENAIYFVVIVHYQPIPNLFCSDCSNPIFWSCIINFSRELELKLHINLIVWCPNPVVRTRNDSKIHTTRTRMLKLKPDLNLNPDMTDCPNFKFGQKNCNYTRFFSTWITQTHNIRFQFIKFTAWAMKT